MSVQDKLETAQSELQLARARADLHNIPTFERLFVELRNIAAHEAQELMTKPLDPYQIGLRQGMLRMANILDLKTSPALVKKYEEQVNEAERELAVTAGADIE